MKKLTGKIISGIGDFSKKMMEIPGYLDAYERKLHMRFFPGTLNIVLEEPYSIPPDSMRLEKEEYGGTVSVYIVPCKMFGRQAYILRTEKNELESGPHSKNIIEVGCDIKLRDEFSLSDGD